VASFILAPAYFDPWRPIFDLTQLLPRDPHSNGPNEADQMGAFLYRCPATGQHVQAWLADDGADDDVHRAVQCLACRRVHLVNPKTRKLLGADDK
jgi:hypothetical protein